MEFTIIVFISIFGLKFSCTFLRLYVLHIAKNTVMHLNNVCYIEKKAHMLSYLKKKYGCGNIRQ